MSGDNGTHGVRNSGNGDPIAHASGIGKPTDSLLENLTCLLAALTDQSKGNVVLVGLLQAIEIQTQRSNELLDRAVVPLSETNRQLREKEIDDYFVLPFARRVIQIIDRVSAEISDTEQQVIEFNFVENCRSIDRVELLELLAMLGIEPITQGRGEKLDTRIQAVGRVCPTTHLSKIERVRRVLRHGYRRQKDDLLIRPALVEVWGSAVAVA